MRSRPAGPNGTIVLCAWDPDWPARYETEKSLVSSALGDRVRLLEHVGSTSVPGLAAKPTIDILLAVADSGDESSYVPDLEYHGYAVRIREPDWHEHRVLKRPDVAVNLHVFTVGSEEIERMLLFRDRLRSDAADRRLYEQTKRRLARQSWETVQDYANAKSEVVAEIMERAMRGRSQVTPGVDTKD